MQAQFLNDRFAKAYSETFTTVSALETELENYLSISPKTADDYVDAKEDIAELESTLAQVLDMYGGMRTACREVRLKVDASPGFWCPPGFDDICEYIIQMYDWLSDTYTNVTTLLASVGTKVTKSVQTWLSDIDLYLHNVLIPLILGAIEDLEPALEDILKQLEDIGEKLGEIGIETLEELITKMKEVAKGMETTVWLINNLWWIAPLTIFGGIGAYSGVKYAVTRKAF